MNIGAELISRVISIVYGGEGIIKYENLIGKIPEIKTLKTIPSTKIFNYRNEINPNAVRLAKKTTEEHKIRNCHFFSDKVEELLPKTYEQYKGKGNSPSPFPLHQGERTKVRGKNIFIVDPPRQGLSKDVLRYISSISIDKLVYISCEPARFARDLFFLSQNGYKVNDIIVADMFPQTKYLETLLFLVNQKLSLTII